MSIGLQMDNTLWNGGGSENSGVWGGLSSAVSSLAPAAAGGPLGAALSFGSSLLGGMLNRSSSSKQNLTAMAFQQAQNDAARENTNYWNERSLSEARTVREWQEKMAGSAHQREVADMRASGLNPILSARGGQGAVTPSPAMSPVHGTPAAGGTPHLEPKRYALGEAVGSALAAREKMLMLDQIEALTEKERAGTGYLHEQTKTEVDRRVNLRADTELKGVEGDERRARIEVIREEEEAKARENFLGKKYGEQKYVGEMAHTKAETRAAEASASLHGVNAALESITLEMYKDNPNMKTIEHGVKVLQGIVGSIVGGAIGGSAVSRARSAETAANKPPSKGITVAPRIYVPHK